MQPCSTCTMPLPNLPKIPEQESKKGGFLKIFGGLSLVVGVANIFGAFGFLNSNVAETNAQPMRPINWLDVHNIGNEMGWSTFP